jgi:endonuclease/exonuclease/phosphatase (EEP) superfamily protein YafD
VGDLNVTPWNHRFRRLMQRSGLMDSSRGRGFQPTWPQDHPLLRIPIDHVLHSPDILVVNRRIGREVNSDHSPVIVDFMVITGETDAADKHPEP